MEKAKNKPTCLQFVLFICLFGWSFEVLFWLLHILTLFAKIKTSINGFLFYFATLCLFRVAIEIFEEIKWWWWRWRWERFCNIFSKKICIWYAKCHATMFFFLLKYLVERKCVYLNIWNFIHSLSLFLVSLARYLGYLIGKFCARFQLFFTVTPDWLWQHIFNGESFARASFPLISNEIETCLDHYRKRSSWFNWILIKF